MSGIYIHIPFCRQACHYCDFHFSTNLKLVDQMTDSILTELISRKEYLNEAVETIYFGGGTPSFISSSHLEKILNQVLLLFPIAKKPEITLEANPEDLSIEKCIELKSLGINRLSIGIQTFDDGKLKWMNRIHDTNQSTSAFENARRAGFDNITMDLMYALPDSEHDLLRKSLEKLISLDPEHISLYGLTIEDYTVFGKLKKEGKFLALPEEEAAKQYLNSIAMLSAHGYLQYEVSNFGKSGFHAKHNLAYWNHKPYLGVGPSAHSYNKHSRSFNIRNNARYIKAIQNKEVFFEKEYLTKIQQFNERILTGLRTTEGIDLNSLNRAFDIDFMHLYRAFINQLSNQGLVTIVNEKLKLAPKGFLIADEIALKLFFHE
ncbi:MAG: radical SAM family heme chaperone HemW [Ekhidna sp.]|nr:radical SAM family heme chaperone HemW [Ekhidna sp.]MBC6409401.1 radical SAM family heme chaperone HemW [Ekhidna sp.]